MFSEGENTRARRAFGLVCRACKMGRWICQIGATERRATDKPDICSQKMDTNGSEVPRFGGVCDGICMPMLKFNSLLFNE